MDSDRLLTETLRRSRPGRALAEIMAAALQAVDPAQAVRANLRRDGDAIVVGARRYAGVERVVVVGSGKARVPMALAACDILGEYVSAGLVVTKEGHLDGLQIADCTIMNPISNPQSAICNSRRLVIRCPTLAA